MSGRAIKERNAKSTRSVVEPCMMCGGTRLVQSGIVVDMHEPWCTDWQTTHDAEEKDVLFNGS